MLGDVNWQYGPLSTYKHRTCINLLVLTTSVHYTRRVHSYPRFRTAMEQLSELRDDEQCEWQSVGSTQKVCSSGGQTALVDHSTLVSASPRSSPRSCDFTRTNLQQQLPSSPATVYLDVHPGKRGDRHSCLSWDCAWFAEWLQTVEKVMFVRKSEIDWSTVGTLRCTYRSTITTNLL